MFEANFFIVNFLLGEVVILFSIFVGVRGSALELKA